MSVHKLSENGAGGSGGRLYNVYNASFNLDTEYLERSNVLSSAQTAPAKTAQGQAGIVRGSLNRIVAQNFLA